MKKRFLLCPDSDKSTGANDGIKAEESVLKLAAEMLNCFTDSVSSKVFEALRSEFQRSGSTSTKEEGVIFDKAALASYLHVDKSWINKQITNRAVPYFKMGKYTRFRKSDIDRWLDTLPKTDPSPYVKLLRR